MANLVKYWKFIAGAFAVLSILGAFLGYGAVIEREGYNKAVAAFKSANDEAYNESLEGANETRKKIQGFDESELDAYLCSDIDIVWENTDCK